MNAQTAEAIVPDTEARDARYWQGRATDLGEQIAKAQAKLEAIETDAAQAALEGKDLPSTVEAEASLRALKRARVLAEEHVVQAEAEAKAAEQAEALEAAKKLAQERIVAAEAVDELFVKLAAAINTYSALSTRWAQTARQGGIRLRRSAEELRGARLAGTLLYHLPFVFEGLGAPRPPHNTREPLADHTRAHIERNTDQ